MKMNSSLNIPHRAYTNGDRETELGIFGPVGLLYRLKGGASALVRKIEHGVAIVNARESAHLTSSTMTKAFKILAILAVQIGITGVSQSEEARMQMDNASEIKSFSISPDGKRLIYEKRGNDKRLYLTTIDDQSTRAIVPSENRKWHMARWSPDGVQVVVISAGFRNEFYRLDDMQIAVVDVDNGTYRELTTGPGVRITPFFSSDGKTIYYFKGEERKSGKTPAANYDLYQIQRESRIEKKLTDEDFYQVLEGDVSPDSNVVMFLALGSKNVRSSTSITEHYLYSFHPNDGSLERREIGVINAGHPRLAKNGDIYFIGAESRGGKYWFGIFKAPGNSGPIRRVVDVAPNVVQYDLYRNGNVLYVNGRDLTRRDLERIPVP